jgi:hypothetical protein
MILIQRHAELVSASIFRLAPIASAEGWTLKQVQGDDLSFANKVL